MKTYGLGINTAKVNANKGKKKEVGGIRQGVQAVCVGGVEA